MISRKSRGPRRRPRKIGIATLAAAAALLGGGQALAPTPAMAMVDSGGKPCSRVTWFDQFTCVVSDEDSGGGGSSGGEVIFVKDKKCGDQGVICVSLGPGKPGPPDPDARQPREGSGRGHQLKPDGSDKGHAVCTKPSTGKEAGVCPGPPGKKKPQKLSDLLKEELERARICRQIQGRLSKYRRFREEIDAGRIAGGPIFEDSPAVRQEFRELWDASIEAEKQEGRKNQCHLELQT